MNTKDVLYRLRKENGLSQEALAAMDSILISTCGEGGADPQLLLCKQR